MMYSLETSLPLAAHAVPAAVVPDSAPSVFARRLSAGLTRCWARGLLPEPTLDPARLEDMALRAEPGRTFNEEDWRPAFLALTHALAAEARLNPIGRVMAHGQLVKALRDRLRLDALWRAHPEIGDIPIRAPIIILGSMRSGTTRVQRLLACDPRLACTRMFESLNPVPGAGFRLIDMRPLKAAAGLAMLRRLNPALQAIHPTGTWMAEEEFGLFSPSFHGAQYETQWHIPGFARQAEARDKAPVYRDFRRLLQTIAWSRGETRPWVLKAPQFMEDLDMLLATFPDARLVCLSRDAVEVVASSASLAWNQQRIQSDAISPEQVGREWLRRTAHRVSRAVVARARRPDVVQVEIGFEAVTQDWLREMARVYAALGTELTAGVCGRMMRYSDTASCHRGHAYRAETFGLNADGIRQWFAADA